MMECVALCVCACARVRMFDTEINGRKISKCSPITLFYLVLKSKKSNTFFSLNYDDVTGWSFLSK